MIYSKALSMRYDRHYNRSARRLNKSNSNRGGQIIDNKLIKHYVAKWGRLSAHVNPSYLKAFSHYIGPDLNIVPEDICHNVIEPILDPVIYRPYFSDKNMFDRILPKGTTPKTFLRRIKGFYYDEEYVSTIVSDESIAELLKEEERVIIKETVDSQSGLGVKMFFKENGIWIDKENGKTLTKIYLEQVMGSDFMVQEYLEQSEFMNRLCSTSVNTIRALTYRSVKDDKVHFLQAIVRIGRDGNFKDNAHQGGVVCGINSEGRLNKYLSDQYGKTFTIHNGIDFSKTDLIIPDFGAVKDFSIQVAECIPYHRIIAHDIMIDKNGHPVNIEFNIRSLGVWLFHYNTGSTFGEYTDEIIDYCASHKNEIKSEYLLI